MSSRPGFAISPLARWGLRAFVAAVLAFIGVKLAHWAGTLASAKMASTGHSGTQASQSMQSCGSM